MDYRKQFRVKPGQKLKLNKLDPAYKAEPASEAEAKKDRRATSRSSPASRPCSTPSTNTRSSSCCRPWTPAARTARSSTCSAASTRRASRRKIQAADAARIRARLSLAGPSPKRPQTGQIVDLQPLPLRRRAGHPGPQAHRQKTCDGRYEHIRDFEALLAEKETTILKFFLHISKEEQLARFAQRLDDPERNWKISESDYSERELWDDYVDAYEDAIRATSTDRSAVVRDPLKPQVVSQSRGVADHCGLHGRSQARLPGAGGQPCRHKAQVSCGG